MPRFSSRQTRWLGLAGLLGGLLWVINVALLLQRGRTDAPAWGRIVPVVVSALVMAGLAGFWTSHAERLGKKGAVGISLLVTAMASYLVVTALADWLLHDPIKSVLGFGFTLLPVPGFILTGLALGGLARAGAFLTAASFPSAMILPSMLATFGVADPPWLRSESPINLPWGVCFILSAAWVGAAGYSTYRQEQSRE